MQAAASVSKVPKENIFCSLKSLHETCSAKVVSEKERFSFGGPGGRLGGGGISK